MDIYGHISYIIIYVYIYIFLHKKFLGRNVKFPKFNKISMGKWQSGAISKA